jgi:hypothetical protein
MIETLHDRFDEDLVAEELTQDETDTEDGFPETSHVGQQVIDVLHSSLEDRRLTVFLEVEVHVNILLCTLKIFLSVEG